MLQPDNGIFIRSWFDSKHDTALKELAPFLEKIALAKPDDVRQALRTERDLMMSTK